jgi:dihydrofolate synthase/folylpolyglutamate synthase
MLLSERREETALLGDLMAIPKFGTGTGLDRMRKLCRELLDLPWMSALDAIKVTGSNGKGSACAMIAAILGELGVRCGLYTSPHLLSFQERIVVDGQPIADGDLASAVHWVLARRDEYGAVHPGDQVGAFEVFTCLALHHFAQARPEALVLEAGIGGRHDSIRIVPGNLVGLTSLDLEHTEVLGPTLDAIACDKADLCPPGGILVVGGIEPAVRRRLLSHCRRQDVRVIDALEQVRPRALAFEGDRMIADLDLDGERWAGVEIGLVGRHQAENAAVAILLVREWLARHRPGIAPGELERAVRRGLAGVRWPARFQRIGRAPEVFADVGHTPGAMARLAETAGAVLRGRRIVLVTGVSYDKRVEQVVTPLLPLADHVICTRAYHKGSPAATIAEIVRRHRPQLPLEIEPRIEGAVERAITLARGHDMSVLIAGGLFLAIEAAQALRGKEPRDLRFF